MQEIPALLFPPNVFEISVHLLMQMCFTSQYMSDGEMKQFFCLGENILLWHCSC